MLGFIFSFIYPILGLILSILGIKRVNEKEMDTSKNLAKTGIVISIIALNAILLSILIVGIAIVRLKFT